MSRRRRAEKRRILPDPKFGSKSLSKFINYIMVDGKKSVAERIVYGAIDIIEQKAANDKNLAVVDDFDDGKSESSGAGSLGLRVLLKGLKNIQPELEVRSRRVGGATYQVPTEVRPERSMALAMRWVRDAARKRSENTMIERLAGEILDAANDRGVARKKKEDTLKMAEANKAFAHFRW